MKDGRRDVCQESYFFKSDHHWTPSLRNILFRLWSSCHLEVPKERGWLVQIYQVLSFFFSWFPNAIENNTFFSLTKWRDKVRSYTLHQTLTRVSISRNSWREMTHSFPSQAGEVDFHISFSSRVSRFWEQKFSFSSRFSRSFIKIIFLLSIFKILKTDFSFSSQFVKCWYWESLSLLNFQGYFLFSPINILKV